MFPEGSGREKMPSDSPSGGDGKSIGSFLFHAFQKLRHPAWTLYAKAFWMRDEPAVMASPIVAMTLRIVVIACLAARTPGVHIRTNQLSHKFGKPFVLSLRPAVRDGSIRALD